jgi:hypothetical protein
LWTPTVIVEEAIETGGDEMRTLGAEKGSGLVRRLFEA